MTITYDARKFPHFDVPVYIWKADALTSEYATRPDSRLWAVGILSEKKQKEAPGSEHPGFFWKTVEELEALCQQHPGKQLYYEHIRPPFVFYADIEADPEKCA